MVKDGRKATAKRRAASLTAASTTPRWIGTGQVRRTNHARDNSDAAGARADAALDRGAQRLRHQGRSARCADRLPPGSRFACPTCGAADCLAYDTQRKTWRQLNFLQHQTYLNARVPRVRCEACGIRQVNVPWSRPDSGFTLLFEAMVMTMVSARPVKAVARIVGEHDTRLWRVVHHYVDEGRARTDASEVTRVAIDETAARRGHDYITLFVDIDQARGLFATEGKDAATVAAFAEDLAAHGGDPAAIEEVCIAMSPAFIKGVTESLPAAAVTFDKFHAVKIINDAVDQVRRAEQKQQDVLRGTRYIWLRNPDTLSERQRSTLSGNAARSKPCRHAISKPHGLIRSAWRSRISPSSRQTRLPVPSRHGTSGRPIAASSRSSRPHTPSSVIGTASCAGSTARSPTA